MYFSHGIPGSNPNANRKPSAAIAFCPAMNAASSSRRNGRNRRSTPSVYRVHFAFQRAFRVEVQQEGGTRVRLMKVDTGIMAGALEDIAVRARELEDIGYDGLLTAETG